MPRLLALAAVPLLVALAGGAAATVEDETVRRSRAVGGWVVEALSEGDGGLMVRMRRHRPAFGLEFHASYWHGNRGPVRRATVRLGACRAGEPGTFENPRAPLPAAAVRERLTRSLEECAASPAEAAAMLGGFARAFALFSAWAGDAERATAAEAAAIAAYGTEPRR